MSQPSLLLVENPVCIVAHAPSCYQRIMESHWLRKFCFASTFLFILGYLPILSQSHEHLLSLSLPSPQGVQYIKSLINTLPNLHICRASSSCQIYFMITSYIQITHPIVQIDHKCLNNSSNNSCLMNSLQWPVWPWCLCYVCSIHIGVSANNISYDQLRITLSTGGGYQLYDREVALASLGAQLV